MMSKQTQDSEPVQLQQIIEGFSTAMMVTQTHDGHLRARPMQIATNEGTDLWFVSGRSSGKIHEIEEHPAVCITLQSSSRYVSLSGNLSIHADRSKIRELWQEDWKVWFPKGKDDPEIVLLRFDNGEGEYWDNSGSKGVGLLLEMGRAYLKGEQADVPLGNHGKVRV